MIMVEIVDFQILIRSSCNENVVMDNKCRKELFIFIQKIEKTFFYWLKKKLYILFSPWHNFRKPKKRPLSIIVSSVKNWNFRINTVTIGVLFFLLIVYIFFRFYCIYKNEKCKNISNENCFVFSKCVSICSFLLIN